MNLGECQDTKCPCYSAAYTSNCKVPDFLVAVCPRFEKEKREKIDSWLESLRNTSCWHEPPSQQWLDKFKVDSLGRLEIITRSGVLYAGLHCEKFSVPVTTKGGCTPVTSMFNGCRWLLKQRKPVHEEVTNTAGTVELTYEMFKAGGGLKGTLAEASKLIGIADCTINLYRRMFASTNRIKVRPLSLRKIEDSKKRLEALLVDPPLPRQALLDAQKKRLKGKCRAVRKGESFITNDGRCIDIFDSPHKITNHFIYGHRRHIVEDVPEVEMMICDKAEECTGVKCDCKAKHAYTKACCHGQCSRGGKCVPVSEVEEPNKNVAECTNTKEGAKNCGIYTSEEPNKDIARYPLSTDDYGNINVEIYDQKGPVRLRDGMGDGEGLTYSHCERIVDGELSYCSPLHYTLPSGEVYDEAHPGSTPGLNDWAVFKKVTKNKVKG